MEALDTSKLCRSCMKEVASWERENFDKRAVEMFSFCTNLKITDEDKLPKQFCYDCIIKIESSFTYITEAQKVDAVLKNIISRTSTSIIVEPETQKTIDIKLTLPDYKVCASIDNDEVVFDNTELPTDSFINVDKVKEENSVITAEENKLNNNKLIKQPSNGIETKKHVCPVCQKEFSSKLWFDKHMKKEHNGPKIVCVHCEKCFKSNRQLSQHSASHREERKYSCAECGKTFKRRNQLSRHYKVHNDIRPFECDKCGMKFKLKSVLKSHMLLHDGDKPFLCYFCGCSFAHSGNLEVHIRKHTGAKPYSCNECCFRSAVASSLKRHQRRHRLIKSHVCNMCNKGFYDSSGLGRHSRTHTGELPFQCPGCSRAFADSWKRKTHLMRAHRLALADIPPMARDGRTKH